MKTYNFRDFMQGTHEIPQPKTQLLLYSSLIPSALPYVLKEMFINKGVLIVGLVGGLAIGLAYMENHLIKKGDSIRANRVAMAGAVILRVIAYGSVLYVLGHLFSRFPI
jgi:hypothetical protein